jgi:hypothetical protein
VIKEMGEKIGRDRAPSRQLKAVACVSASSVVSTGLVLIADNEPKRHVCIRGWAESKEDRMMQAQLVAQNARLLA